MPLPRVRFKVHGQSCYIAFVGVLLALTQLPFLAGCAVLLVGITASNFLLPTRMWRFLTYGGIAGIVVASIILSCYLEFGIRGPRTYTDGRLEVVYLVRPYVVQMGALAGGSLGLVVFSSRAKIVAHLHVPSTPREPE